LKLSSLSILDELAFREPIMITQQGTIVDGYARCELARRQGRATLACIEYDLTDEEALVQLVQSQRPRSGLNSFCRVLLSLDLEPSLQEAARSNQQAGGRYKGSSTLTEAQTVDVRSEIAKIAGVSVGNVTKVKQVLKLAHPDVMESLRTGEIRIHRAWMWSKQPLDQQRVALGLYRSERGVNRKIQALLARHQPRALPPIPVLRDLVERLSARDFDVLKSISLSVVKVPGKGVYITEELLEELQTQGGLGPTCT
jgi:hypothetical protein